VTDQRYHHFIIIRDRSGSIDSILDGMQSGYDEFITSQVALQEPPHNLRVTGSLWDFDDVIECVASFRPPAELAGLPIVPRNMTALNEAIGQAMTAEGGKLAAMPEHERPGQVTVLIASDGLQTVTPVEWHESRVTALVKQQREVYGWNVIYIGTNQDAIAQGRRLGGAGGQSLSYLPNDKSTHSAWRVSASNIVGWNVALAAAPAGASISVPEYTDEQREIVMNGEA
jgi:hypothetical protein